MEGNAEGEGSKAWGPQGRVGESLEKSDQEFGTKCQVEGEMGREERPCRRQGGRSSGVDSILYKLSKSYKTHG